MTLRTLSSFRIRFGWLGTLIQHADTGESLPTSISSRQQTDIKSILKNTLINSIPSAQSHSREPTDRKPSLVNAPVFFADSSLTAWKDRKMDHLACMATFAAVVEKGGFAAAARYLSLAPATVTLQIQTLEHRIGARLLQRTTRMCTLTEAGNAFYERVVKILQDVEEADAAANAFHATSRGTIRLQASPTISQEVSMLVARYVPTHPETSFHLTTTGQMGNLLDNRIDLAIRDDEVAESSLIVRRLARAEWTACASPGHVARHGLPVHPAELAEHDCLVYVRDRDWDEWRFAGEGGNRSIRVSGSLRSSDPHVLRMAALADQGLILLPDAMVSEDLQAGHLVRILNGYSAEPATIRAVYPSRRQISLKVRTFLDFVAMAYGASPDLELRTAIGTNALRSILALGGRRQSTMRGG